MTFSTRLACAALVLVCAAADWPQFRGPDRNDVSTEAGLRKTWPQGGPTLVWTAKGIGNGYSSVSVAGDRVYTLGNKGKVSSVIAIDRANGKVVWSAPIGPPGGNLGCTPTVDGSRIYALGQEGDLVCVEARDGARIWHRNLLKEFGGSYGGWKYCESPLVDGETVVVTPGGKEATMIAFDKTTGKVAWKCSLPLKHTQAGYSSIVVAEVGGIRQYVQLLNGGVVGVATDGRFLWKYEKLGPNTANIPTPIILQDHVFSSAGYGKGGALLRLKAVSDGVNAEEVYFNRRLTNKHGGVVCVAEHVYGDTDDRGMPFCADVRTGKVLWTRERDQGDGRKSVSVTYADGMLYWYYENGIVALTEASPRGYKEVGSFKVANTSGPCWAHPVVCGGKLYIRSADNVYCYDVRAVE